MTVTCGFWEDTTESLDSIARWRDLVAANADLARNLADVLVELYRRSARHAAGTN